MFYYYDLFLMKKKGIHTAEDAYRNAVGLLEKDKKSRIFFREQD